MKGIIARAQHGAGRGREEPCRPTVQRSMITLEYPQIPTV